MPLSDVNTKPEDGFIRRVFLATISKSLAKPVHGIA
jgi:hypothetical protein